MAIERQVEIRRRKSRKKRLGKLKEKLAVAKTAKDRERLIDLISRREAYFKPPKK